jgi:SAM-dependent methyltransferase
VSSCARAGPLAGLLQFLLRKLVVNRLPRGTLLWERASQHIEPLLVGETGLDLGCGPGSALPFGRLRWYGLDLHPPSLLRAAQRGGYRGLVCADVGAVDRVVRERSVDVVVALDVVEHFQKPEAVALLDAMERLAKRRVIVLTPNGFVPQEPGGTAHNPWMAHRCGWTVDDLRRRGYRVRGYSGWKGGAGPGWWIRNNLDALFQLLMTATQPLVADRPHLAFHLLAWKDVEAGR